MLSTPRSLGFVVAAILGAMLVPGCRPEDGLSGPSDSPEVTSPQFSSSQVLPDQYIVVFKSSLPDAAASNVKLRTRDSTKPDALMILRRKTGKASRRFGVPVKFR